MKDMTLAHRVLSDGRELSVVPMIYTFRLCIGTEGDETGYDDAYCFHDVQGAIKACMEWDGTGDPEGWHRHIGSGRRRDPETGKEWVAP